MFSIGDLVTHPLTDSLRTFLIDKKEYNCLQTFQTSDQSDEGTCPDPQKDKHNDKDKDTYNLLTSFDN